MKKLFAVLVALGVIGAGALFVIAREALEPVGPVDGERAALELFVVEPGAVLRGVAKQLQERGLIRDERAARLWARFEEPPGQLRAGEFELSPSWSTPKIIGHLYNGPIKTYAAVIPEGIRATEVAQRLEDGGLVDAEDFLAVVRDPAFARSLGIGADHLEGYLFPETYRMPRGLSAKQVARILVKQFFAAWQGIEERAKATGMSMHEVVTLASIVEKETGAPEERPLIAAVFLNRLKKGMRLETDPTVIYGIEDFDGNLTRAHLEDRTNPYNTYRIESLPPGPIASPGREALLAVVEPADTEYLFFVSRNDGTHKFSKTYQEHDRAVTQFQRRRRKQ